MSLRRILIALGGLAVVIGIATLVVIQTDWFREYVRTKIISTTEEATGGKVEIGAFSFEVSHLRAAVTNFVIHGREPAGAAPFVRAERVQVDLRFFTSIKRLLDITYLGIEKPQVNVIVLSDGSTNIPTPKDQKPQSDTTALETVVNLAVGHFQLSNGVITANAQSQAVNLEGNNLQAELWFNPLTQSYSGKLALEPLYVAGGRNTPVTFRVTLPVTLEKDRLELKNATITTATSTLAINGALENLRNPKLSGRIRGHISIADLRNAGNLPLGLAGQIDIDAEAIGDRLTRGHIALGHSTIDASGPFTGVQFQSTFAVGELGRMLAVAQKPDGTVQLNGTVKNNVVDGTLVGSRLSFAQAGRRYSNIEVRSGVHFDPHSLRLDGLRLNALGGEFTGDASLADFRRYEVDGKLRGLDIAAIAHLPYSGSLSGPVSASGDLEGGLTARTSLTIAPGKRGVPVSGKLVATYNGGVTIQNSYLSLPHSKLTLNGALGSGGNRINISLVSRDLKDFPVGGPNIQLAGGQANFTGAVTGAITNPVVAGHLEVSRFSIEGREFQTLAADLTASGSGAAVRNGSLTRATMNAAFSGTVGLHNWSPLPRDPLAADLTLTGGDIADVAVLAGKKPAGYSGALTAQAHIQGTVGNPQGSADIQAASGTLDGETFDRAEAHVNLADQLVTIPAAFITSGAQRVDLSGEFRHPGDSFTTGQVRAHLKAGQVDLAKVQLVQTQSPKTGGIVQLDVDVAGNLTATEFLVTQVDGTGSAKGISVAGQAYGDATLSAKTVGQTVSYNVTSNFAGSATQVSGSTQLVRDYPITADATVSRLPLQRMLVLAKQGDIPARGDLSGTVHFAGTMANPQGTADLVLANAVIYDEPLDRVHASVNYLPTAVDVTALEVTAGAARIDLTGRYDHPAGNLNSGRMQFKVASTKINLAAIRNAQKLRPGLGGVLQINADGAGTVAAGTPQIRLSSLNADVEATALTVQKIALGNLSLKADTSGGNQVRFALDSNLAGATIHGEGRAELSPDYPVDAKVTFSNVAYQRLSVALGGDAGTPAAFEAVTDGSLELAGPLMKTEQLRGTLQLTKVNVDTVALAGMRPAVSIRNEGAVRVVMNNGAIRVENAHLVGPQTDVQVTGTASLPQQTMSMNVNARVNLGLLQSMSRDIVSSGEISVAAGVRGTFAIPNINGQMELKNASFNYAPVPNGISNANGVVVFNGTTATIRSLTAETGGGKLTASGFAGYSNGARFGLRVNASGVRWRLQQGVSAVGSADIRLTGTDASSVVSGNVTVEQLNYAPQSDIGAMLSRTATPVQSETAPSPLLDNMKLDIRVRTSPSLGVQASLAQNLQASADLRVRGTVARPGVLGRVTISEGKLVFFGSTYTVNSGTIGFYDPLRVVPVLNINLETQAKGVDVVLTVTGPIDNMKLSYSSDPPLQFQEIVGLLASGKTPTSDPTLLANEPAQPAQSFEQMGESALVSKALADPVASRLQRVFGVTQLKIDPAFTSGSLLPTARLTFQQQITSKVTFTYTSALDDPNSTIIRAEWSLNPQYSAVASRDQNGLISVLLFYKKQFR